VDAAIVHSRNVYLTLCDRLVKTAIHSGGAFLAGELGGDGETCEVEVEVEVEVEQEFESLLF
jgi:hypothetical protein